MSVRIGQVYRDRDKRESRGNRHVRVVAIETRPIMRMSDFAVCEYVWMGIEHWYEIAGKPTRIRLDRLTSSRFELVEDVTG